MAMKAALIEQGFKKVLLVENPWAEMKVLERVFAPAGCVLIDTRYTAESARDAVWRERPSIIVLDGKLGADTPGEGFLKALAVIKDYSPIVIGLSEELATDSAAAIERNPLVAALREASDRLDQSITPEPFSSPRPAARPGLVEIREIL